jgi:hypothetical protein
MLATLGFMLIAPSRAEATPLGLDLEKIVDQAQKPAQRFAPARAGWDGPMMPTHKQAATGASFSQMMNEAALTQATRAQIEAIAIPDPRVLVGLATLILLLRKWREMRQPVPRQVPQAA